MAETAANTNSAPEQAPQAASPAPPSDQADKQTATAINPKFKAVLLDKLARLEVNLRDYERLRIKAADEKIRSAYVNHWVYESNHFFTLCVRIKNRMQGK